MDEQQKRLAEELLFSETKKPSFAKLLYFGILDSSRVFPYPRPDPGLDAYLNKVEAFASQKIDGTAIDRQAEIPPAVIKGLGDLGLLGLTIPKEYGGQELSQHAYCKAIELIAKQCSSTALFINAHQSIGLKALVLFGTPEQKKKWLPPLARGEMLAAFALTEPNAGSDASGVETRAVYDPTKKTYRITGRKQWITNGGMAGMLTVMAKTEDGKITAFIISPDMPGFSVRNAALEKVGMRGTKTSILDFNEVEVPASNILGPPGGGLRVCLTVLDYGRTTFGASCTGTAKVLLEKALEHARTRIQFKQPLAAFPLIKEKLAAIAGLTYAMEATTYLTAGLLDSHEEDIMLEAAMLKVFASDALWKIIYETMQIYGGRSFFTDEPLERMMRDARLNMIGEGANEVLRAFIGVVGMRDVGMQLKEFQDALLHPFDKGSTLLRLIKSGFYRLHTPTVPISSSSLQAEAKMLGKGVKELGFAVIGLLAKHREGIVDKEFSLNRIASSAMSIYTTTAVLSKLDNDLQAGTVTPGMAAAARLFCRQAMKRAHRSLKMLSRNDDDDIEKVSDLLIKERS